MSKEEEKLYPEIVEWLKKYLSERYKEFDIEVTSDTSKQFLDKILKNKNIIIKEAIGLKIKVDIVGILKRNDEVKLIFVEVKDDELTLKDLGQLWGYTQLLNPTESFLISPKGFGKLSHLFNVLKREDILKYGIKENKFMRIANWDRIRKTIDWGSIIPKI